MKVFVLSQGVRDCFCNIVGVFEVRKTAEQHVPEGHTLTEMDSNDWPNHYATIEEFEINDENPKGSVFMDESDKVRTMTQEETLKLFRSADEALKDKEE